MRTPVCSPSQTDRRSDRCPRPSAPSEAGADRVEMVDFVLPTLAEALAYIAEGATNKLDLLEQSGLTTAEAEAELKRIEAAE
jgi:hypothetical protein